MNTVFPRTSNKSLVGLNTVNTLLNSVNAYNNALSAAYLRDSKWRRDNNNRITTTDRISKTIRYDYLQECLFDSTRYCYIKVCDVVYDSWDDEVYVTFLAKSRTTDEVFHFSTFLETAFPGLVLSTRAHNGIPETEANVKFRKRFNDHFIGKVFSAREHTPNSDFSRKYLHLEVLYNTKDLYDDLITDADLRFICRVGHSVN